MTGGWRGREGGAWGGGWGGKGLLRACASPFSPAPLFHTPPPPRPLSHLSPFSLRNISQNIICFYRHFRPSIHSSRGMRLVSVLFPVPLRVVTVITDFHYSGTVRTSVFYLRGTQTNKQNKKMNFVLPVRAFNPVTVTVCTISGLTSAHTRTRLQKV